MGLLQEARILRDCRDRNIVQLVGICTSGANEDGVPEEAVLVGGVGTLGGWVGGRTFPPLWRRVWAGQGWRLVGRGWGASVRRAWNRPAVPCYDASLGAPPPPPHLTERPCQTMMMLPSVSLAMIPTPPAADRPAPPPLPLQLTEFMEAGDLFRALRWRDHKGRRVFGWAGRCVGGGGGVWGEGGVGGCRLGAQPICVLSHGGPVAHHLPILLLLPPLLLRLPPLLLRLPPLLLLLPPLLLLLPLSPPRGGDSCPCPAAEGQQLPACMHAGMQACRHACLDVGRAGEGAHACQEVQGAHARQEAWGVRGARCWET